MSKLNTKTLQVSLLLVKKSHLSRLKMSKLNTKTLQVSLLLVKKFHLSKNLNTEKKI